MSYTQYQYTSVCTDVTNSNYTVQRRLQTVFEPDDSDTNTHVAWGYAYETSSSSTAGRLLQVSQYYDTKSDCRTVQYGYDTGNRVNSVTYGGTTGDSSLSEEYLYGVSTDGATLGYNSAAGKLLAYKDRNGYVTEYLYDSSGRLQQATAAKYQVTASTGGPGTILDGHYPG